MRKRTAACVITFSVGFVLFLWGVSIYRLYIIRTRPPSPLPLEVTSGSNVIAGMQVAVKSLRREGDKLLLGYTFRWVGKDRTFCFMRPWGKISLSR